MYFGINWMDYYTYVGILGVLFITTGIWRTSSGKWNNKSILYELDTVTGAGLMAVYQIHSKAFVALPISVLLVFVSFRGITSYAERYEAKHKNRKNKSKRS